MIEINEKNIPKKNNLFLTKSLYLVKKNFISSETGFYFLFFLKYLGVIANSRIIEMVTCKDSVYLNKYIKNLFLFGNDFSIMHKNYFPIIIALAAIILFFYVFFGFSLLYMKYKYKNITSIIEEKSYGTNEKLENILFKMVAYINFIFIFFNQYFLEYTFFGIFGFIYNQIGITTKTGPENKKYANYLEAELIDYLDNTNHIPILIINIIFVAILFFNIGFYLMFCSIRGLFLFKGILCGNIKYIILKLLMFSFQPFFVLTKFYNDDTQITIGIIFNVIIIFLCFFTFCNCFYQFGYYPNNIANMCLYLEFFAFVSSIDELILYKVGYKTSSIFFFVKIFIEIINSYILTLLFLYLKDKRSMNNFAKNLFSKNSTDTSKAGLYYYMRVFLEYQKNKHENYVELFRIIMLHVKQCKKMDCPGHLLIPKDYLQSLFIPFSYKDKSDYKNNIFANKESKDIKEEQNESNNDSENEQDIDDEKNNLKEKENINLNNNSEHSHISIEKKKLTEKQFQIIFEQEIINKIEYLYKTKKIYDLEHFIFIHIQYLYKMKKNYALTLYYIGKYSKCGIKWSFITEYYLYEYKISIIHSYFNKLNINNADKTVNKYRKDNLFMSEIINYFVLLALLKQLIITSCDKLKILFNFRKNLHNPIMIKTYKHSNTNKFFKIGEELKYDIDKILYLTRLGLNQENKDNISAELIYIISNFLFITLNKIPDDLRKIVNPNFDINSISAKLESGYKFFNLVHPLILTLTKNNTFNISYFSCVISNRLGFHQHELKDKDFHEKLFPGVKFIKQHELLMKQFLFFSYNTFAKANTFIKSKDGYLIGVSMVAKKYPTFYEDFFIIIGLDFNEKLFYSRINKRYNRYSFLLDENSEFIAETRNFVEDFEFNVSMFKDIKTNFFEFFCVDKNLIIEKIKKKNKKLFKHSVNNIYNLKKEEDAFTLFKNISYEKAYELRDIAKLETLNKNYIIIHDKIDKDKIIRVIPEFTKLIEEYGLDFEWYQHLQNLSDRLSMKEIKNYVEDNLDNTLNTLTMGQTISSQQIFKNTLTPGSTNNIGLSLNLKNKEIKEIKENNLISSDSLGRPSYASISSASKKNFNNKMMRISFDRNFDVVYNLKKMGTIYFYIVDLYERTLYTDESGLVKKNYSFKNRKQNSPQLKNSKKNENNQFIKAKTIFNNKLTINKNFDFPSSKVVLKDDKSNKNKEDFKVLEKTKTWENENNNYLGEHLNNEEEIKTPESHNIRTEEGKKSNLISNSKPKEGFAMPRKSRKDIISIKNGLNEKSDFYDNNSSFYNYKSNKDEDDENISLISKDQIEELRKRDRYFNKIYIIILSILFIFTIIIIGVKLYFATTNFNYILNLTSSLIYLEEIKSDIFIGSIIVLSQCLRKQQNDTPTGLNAIYLQLGIKGADLMTHVNAFEKQLNIIKDNSLLTRIRQSLYKNITIGNLNKDWSLKIEISCLIDEINYFSYLLNSASQELLFTMFTDMGDACVFNENFFLLSSVNDPYEIYKISQKETTFNQRFIYYVLDNIIYEIQPIISDISEEIIIALIKTLDSYLDKIMILYCCMLAFILGIQVTFLIKNNSDIFFIRQIFVFLYNYENNQLKKEYEINFLEKVAKEFNINNLTLLEKIKKDNNFFYSLVNANSGQLINDNSNNHEESYNKINDKSLISTDKNGKIKTKEKQDESLVNDYQKIKNNLDLNSMNGSLLNNSINNNSSMVQFLNKNNNRGILNDLKNEAKSTNKIKRGRKNKSLKINKGNKMKYNEDQKIFKENEDVLELIKSSKKIVPLNTIISIYVSIFLSLLFLATLIISLFDLFKKKDTWEYAVNLSMNYLEKIPKIVEIAFTSYLTTILGRFKADYYSLEEYKLHQDTYLKYFTKRKGYDKSELISTSMNPSYFMNKLYDNYRLKKNLDFCENDNYFSGHFKLTKLWIKKLDEKNNFCINSGLGGALFFNKDVNDVHTYFSYVEQMAVACREEGEKLDESGLNLEIDFVLQELTYMYSDFEQQMKIDLNLARKMFFGDSNNLRILKDMNVPFSFASGTIYYAVDKDMNDLTNYISKFELIFIVITFIIDGLFLLYIFWIVTLNEKDKNAFLYITKIIQRE